MWMNLNKDPVLTEAVLRAGRGRAPCALSHAARARHPGPCYFYLHLADEEAGGAAASTCPREAVC